MLTLPFIFGDNALFLHSSHLTISGNAEKCSDISIKIIKNADIFGQWSGKSDANGSFSITISTPAASYDYCDIVICDENDERVIKNVLFGELWLACGQSNMEMPHTLQPEWPQMREKIKDKRIRAFFQPRLAHTDEYPFEPSSQTEGYWRTTEDEEFISVSAIATEFSSQIYDFLAARGEECPVGFINTNRGGTCIKTWIPSEAFAKNPRIANLTPSADDWNTKGESNYQQPSAHFNRHLGAVLGIRARGMLWYQGESDVGMENTSHCYKDLMAALRESYKERFSPSADDTFPMISVQLFPWKYSDFNDTKMGYMNMAFSDMAKIYPDEYPFVPICDLPWIWGKWGGNHPIHPIHKYKIGERIAILTLNKYYGRRVKDLQTLPPMLKSCVRHGSKLRLTFCNVGSGLYVKGTRAVGLYIRSKDGVYTPAYCEVVSKNVMNVYHPYIEKPCHVAYAVSSLEPKANIFAGEFPVTPFCTEFVDGVNNQVTISLKPWLNNELDSAFVGETVGSFFDFFNRAVFNPSVGSGVCYDSDFSLSSRCLRIYALDHSSKEFGAYILASQYATLDLQNYSALKFMLFHHASLDVKLALHYEEANGTCITHTITASRAESGRLGWLEHSFDLSAIPEGRIKKAELIFIRGENRLSYVFIDDLILVPKN